MEITIVSAVGLVLVIVVAVLAAILFKKLSKSSKN